MVIGLVFVILTDNMAYFMLCNDYNDDVLIELCRNLTHLGRRVHSRQWSSAGQVGRL